MTYQDKLKDPRWQKKRLEILERDNWKCHNCDDEKATLHVHHIGYDKNKDPCFAFLDYYNSCVENNNGQTIY